MLEIKWLSWFLRILLLRIWKCWSIAKVRFGLVSLLGSPTCQKQELEMRLQKGFAPIVWRILVVMAWHIWILTLRARTRPRGQKVIISFRRTKGLRMCHLYQVYAIYYNKRSLIGVQIWEVLLKPGGCSHIKVSKSRKKWNYQFFKKKKKKQTQEKISREIIE